MARVCRASMNGKGSDDQCPVETCQVCHRVLSEMGLRIVRFRNEEVMKNLSAVVGKIRDAV